MGSIDEEKRLGSMTPTVRTSNVDLALAEEKRIEENLTRDDVVAVDWEENDPEVSAVGQGWCVRHNTASVSNLVASQGRVAIIVVAGRQPVLSVTWSLDSMLISEPIQLEQNAQMDDRDRLQCHHSHDHCECDISIHHGDLGPGVVSNRPPHVHPRIVHVQPRRRCHTNVPCALE